jgi:hypothetical protein
MNRQSCVLEKTAKRGIDLQRKHSAKGYSDFVMHRNRCAQTRDRNEIRALRSRKKFVVIPDSPEAKTAGPLRTLLSHAGSATLLGCCCDGTMLRADEFERAQPVGAVA